MLMALCWFLTLAELLPLNYALTGASAIGIMPSLLREYNFFMTETITLTTMAMATWLTLRAMRKKTNSASFLAIFLWTAASFTRLTTLPVALVCIAILWWCMKRSPAILIMASASFLAFGIPAAQHTYAQLRVYDPLGYSHKFNEIYRASPSETIFINVHNKGLLTRLEFTSDHFLDECFNPLMEWHSPRWGKMTISINTEWGKYDWEEALEKAKRKPRFQSAWAYWLDNFVGMVFGSVWPAGSWPANIPHNALIRGVNASRWLILPMLVTICVGLCFHRLKGAANLIPAIAILIFCILIFQNTGIGSGRMRVPGEPYLIASLWILGHQKRQDKAKKATLNALEQPVSSQ